MSDFFSDDFTAELKKYFLQNLIQEAEKFIDLVDESHWARIRSEVSELSSAWAVDAKTNEFLFLTEWLEGFADRVRPLQNASDFLKALGAIKSYAESLIKEGADSAELATHYSLAVESRQEVVLLQCKWGEQDFAIPLLKVVEISGGLNLYELPDKRQGLAGVIPFRGEAVPVVSLEEHGFISTVNKSSLYIICEHESVRFALQITATDELFSLRESELLSVEGSETMITAPFVRQFFVKNNKSIMILDVEKMVA